MIEWLNLNQGFVFALLTSVYVVTTIVLVILNLKSLQHAADAERRRYRPCVIFDIYSEQFMLYASLKNIGTSPAINVHLSSKPEIFKEFSKQHRLCPFIKYGVSFLAPGREVRDAFDFGGNFEKHFPGKRFTGTVSYEDSDCHTYNESFDIDLSYQNELAYVLGKDIGTEIEHLYKSVERLSSPSFQPLIRTIDEAEYQRQEKKKYQESLMQEEQRKSETQQPVGGDSETCDNGAGSGTPQS